MALLALGRLACQKHPEAAPLSVQLENVLLQGWNVGRCENQA